MHCSERSALEPISSPALAKLHNIRGLPRASVVSPFPSRKGDPLAPFLFAPQTAAEHELPTRNPDVDRYLQRSVANLFEFGSADGSDFRPMAPAPSGRGIRGDHRFSESYAGGLLATHLSMSCSLQAIRRLLIATGVGNSPAFTLRRK
jgi:hypothetical protein